jgi:hypothetical protein
VIIILQYYSHLKYTIRHKYYVLIECIKEGIIIRGIIHDWDKFLPLNFSAYANYFFEKDGSRKKVSKNNVPETDPFYIALNNHQNNNDHHLQYWVELMNDGNTKVNHMSLDAMKELICDWKGAGLATGTGGEDNPLSWYKKNRDGMIMHTMTRNYIEMRIGYETDWVKAITHVNG